MREDNKTKTFVLIEKIGGKTLSEQRKPVDGDFVIETKTSATGKKRVTQYQYKERKPLDKPVQKLFLNVESVANGLKPKLLSWFSGSTTIDHKTNTNLSVGSETKHSLKLTNDKGDLITKLNKNGDITFIGGEDGLYIIPIQTFKGGVHGTVKVQFKGSVATMNIKWENVGIYLITESNINAFLPPHRKVRFEQLSFSIY